jgi:hypothetical protein
MKKAVWLSFDLGVNGDYEGMYSWLDNHEAKECGDSVAFIEYDQKSNIVQEISRELKKSVKINARSRVYMIYLKEGKMKGCFILGGRKQAPWTGYGPWNEEESSDESLDS